MRSPERELHGVENLDALDDRSLQLDPNKTLNAEKRHRWFLRLAERRVVPHADDEHAMGARRPCAHLRRARGGSPNGPRATIKDRLKQLKLSTAVAPVAARPTWTVRR